MKTIFLALMLAVLSGCSTVEKFALKREPVKLREAATNEVQTVVTNFVQAVKEDVVVVKPAATNEAGVFIPAVTESKFSTNYIPTLVTNVVQVVMPEVWGTNLSLNPVIQSGAEKGAALTGIPWASTAVSLLGGLGTLFFHFLNKRNAAKVIALADGKAQAEGALETAKLVGQTLIENVETIRKAALTVPGYAAQDATVMKYVQMAQAAAGVKSEIHDLVEEHTDYTKS